MSVRSTRPVAARVAAVAAAALLVAACSSGNVFELAEGDCFDDPEDMEDQITDVEVVDCDEPHDNEVFLVADLPEGDFPGDEALTADADERCVDGFESYVGSDYFESELFLGYLTPSEESWASGDREIVCVLYEPGVKLEGSMQGSGR